MTLHAVAQIRSIGDLIGHLRALEDAGGGMVLYELTPKWRMGEGQVVDFRAEILMPDGWKVKIG